MTQGQFAILSGAVSAATAYTALKKALGTEKFLWGGAALVSAIWAFDAYQKYQAGDASTTPVLPGVLP